jgi:hypothetical protein
MKPRRNLGLPVSQHTLKPWTCRLLGRSANHSSVKITAFTIFFMILLTKKRRAFVASLIGTCHVCWAISSEKTLLLSTFLFCDAHHTYLQQMTSQNELVERVTVHCIWLHPEDFCTCDVMFTFLAHRPTGSIIDIKCSETLPHCKTKHTAIVFSVVCCGLAQPVTGKC